VVENRFLDPVLRCSTACTRAGLAALTFSVLAFSLLQPLEKAGDTDALLQYLYFRVALGATIKGFDPVKCWKNQSWDSIKDSEFSSLIDKRCDAESELDRARMEDNKKDIDIYLMRLRDYRLLERARSANYHQYDGPIYDWVNYRAELIGPLYDKRGLVSATRTFPRSNGQVPHYTRKELLDHLTFNEVKQLAGADNQKNNLSEIEHNLADAEKLAMPWAAGPIDVVAASTITELGLLFSVICFWLYLCEGQRAISISSHSGTLFSVFKATTISQLIFGALVLVPVGASLLVARNSSFAAGRNLYFSLFIIMFSFLIICRSQSEKWAKRCFLAVLFVVLCLGTFYAGRHAQQSVKSFVHQTREEIKNCGQSGFVWSRWRCQEDETGS
jgi:hypothetical protein